MTGLIARLAVFLILGLCSNGSFASLHAEAPLPTHYAKWLNEDVTYIISDVERVVFLRCKTDGERDLFIESFWKARDPDPATVSNEFKEQHYRRLTFVNAQYSSPETPGWKTELGRLYIVTGGTWPVAPDAATAPVRLRIFVGIKEGAGSTAAPPVTSSYVTSVISASVEAESDIEKAQEQLASVFNLKAVTLLTEAELAWPGPGQGSEILHMFDLDGNPYLLDLSPLGERVLRRFHISVAQNRPLDAERKMVLDTDIVLPDNKTAIFGFQNAAGRPYFLSVSISALPNAGISPAADRVAAQESQGRKGGGEDFDKGAVRCSALVPLPRLVRGVDAVYPEIAKQAKVEGIVNMDVRIDRTGRVEKVRLLNSIPLLDQAAVDAVRQWVFEPVVVDGAAVEAILTAGIAFSFRNGELGAAVFRFPQDKIVTGAVKIEGETPPPKCLKSVAPVYPEIARQAKVEGLVVLGVRTDEEGRVEAVQVLRSVPLLDQAAVDAVRQWVYEPLVIHGKPRKAAFTVSLRVGPGSGRGKAYTLLDSASPSSILFDPMIKTLQELGYGIGRFERSANLSGGFPYIEAEKKLPEKDLTLRVLVRFIRKAPVTHVEVEVEGAGRGDMNTDVAKAALDQIVSGFDEALKVR